MVMNSILIFIGKFVSSISKIARRGSGSTWPGHIALSVNPYFIQQILNKNPQLKIIFIAGTNGKTTTSKMITTILQGNNKRVMYNDTGANLLNGIASSLIHFADGNGVINKDIAVFEVDENTLPLILKQANPFAVIALNLFRDQLDRYGELDSIAKKWKEAFMDLTQKTKLLLNADDPQVAFLGDRVKARTMYFGLEEKGQEVNILQHASDSIYCPRCHNRLQYKKIYFSHLGIWRCGFCKLTRPKVALSHGLYPLPGMYNQYNTLAAILVCLQLGFSDSAIEKAIALVTPAFGRQEKIMVDGKTIQVFLAKNPASFNQTISTIASLGATYILFVLNDRIPDGRDVSWIWDIDIEEFLPQFLSIFVSGDRVYDMQLRLSYAGRNKNIYVYEKLAEGIWNALENLPQNETLYVLPTYSAMLDVRKIITGRKIL